MGTSKTNCRKWLYLMKTQTVRCLSLIVNEIRLMEEIPLTSWYGKYPIICKVFFNIPGGCLGFLPLTVSPNQTLLYLTPVVNPNITYVICPPHLFGNSSKWRLKGWDLNYQKRISNLVVMRNPHPALGIDPSHAPASPKTRGLAKQQAALSQPSMNSLLLDLMSVRWAVFRKKLMVIGWLVNVSYICKYWNTLFYRYAVWSCRSY